MVAKEVVVAKKEVVVVAKEVVAAKEVVVAVAKADEDEAGAELVGSVMVQSPTSTGLEALDARCGCWPWLGQIKKDSTRTRAKSEETKKTGQVRFK